MFKQAFKLYKKKTPASDLQDVIDFDLFEENNSSSSWCNLVKPVNISEINKTEGELLPVGLRSKTMWRCYRLLNHPGLLVLRNSFTSHGQRYWIARSLRDFPRSPNITNLNANNLLALVSDLSNDWWRGLQECTNDALTQRIKAAMRWTTLGYHHNWDTKVYNEAMHTEFPSDLSSMCQYYSQVLGFNKFTPQAAIVNYYPIGTTLSGHTDRSELNLGAPLFSFSFGQAAIFLIGGKSLEEQPTALYLRSGDVLIMSMESRLCYHAVPRVIKEEKEPWNLLNTTFKVSSNEQINMDANSMDLELFYQVKDEIFWNPFNRYTNDSRININVRQVLPAGVSKIPLS